MIHPIHCILVNGSLMTGYKKDYAAYTLIRCFLRRERAREQDDGQTMSHASQPASRPGFKCQTAVCFVQRFLVSLLVIL
jgi:hypothetical protein